MKQTLLLTLLVAIVLLGLWIDGDSANNREAAGSPASNFIHAASILEEAP